MKQDDKRVRELTGNERKFLWIPAANVNVTARVRGDLPEQRVRMAVEKLEERHPLLRCRVAYEADRAWFTRSGVPRVPVRFVERTREDRWVEEVMREHRTPFRPMEGPLIRFMVVRSDEVSEVIVFCQHSVCDGTALVYVVRDLLGLVADPGREAEPLPLPPPLTPDNLPPGSDSSGLGAKLRNAAIGSINRKWRRNPMTFDQEDFENIFDAYWSNNDYRVLFLEMDEGPTRRLVVACRERGVTVNSALCGAFLCAYRELEGDFTGSNKTIAVPVDLRRRMKPEAGDVLCLCVGSMLLRYEYRPGESFWDNTRRIHRIFSERMDRADLFKPFHNLERLDHRLLESMLSFAQMSPWVAPGASRYEKLHSFGTDRNNMAVKMLKKFTGALPGMTMTNLGRVKIDAAYGDLTIERLYFLPSTGRDIPLVLGAVTIGGSFTVTVNYIGPEREALLRRVRDRAGEILRSN